MKQFIVTGKMSTFGGPHDLGVGRNEALGLFPSEQIMRQHGVADYLLTPQEAGAPGLARRLNPHRYYLACRWHVDGYPWLRDHAVWVKANGKTFAARPMDWGPSETETDRDVDLSPGLAEALGLDTDDTCTVIADPNDFPPAATDAGSQAGKILSPGMVTLGQMSGAGNGVGSISPPNGRAAIQEMFGKPNNNDGTLNEVWEAQNIRLISPPVGWQLYYQDDDRGPVPVSGIRMHRKLEDSFHDVLNDIWNYAKGQLGGAPSDSAIRDWLHQQRVDQHSGGFNYRPIHGTSHLSLHSYGIAIDWDADHNPQGQSTHTLPDWWYDIWNARGWSDGRHFSNPDPMHVQFATGA